MNGRSPERVHWPVVGGFFALAVPGVVLVFLGVLGAMVLAGMYPVGLVLLAATIAILLGIRFEWMMVWRSSVGKSTDVDELARITVAILVGTVVTLGLVIDGGLSPIVAAGLVGIAVAIVAPSVAIPAYCGAFVGMTSPELFTTYWHALLAGGFASGVYAVARPVFHGVGGKLGTTAFVGATMAVVVTSGSFQSDPLPDSGTIALVLGYSVIGAVATYSLHTRLPPDPVFSSGLVGAVGGLALPAVHGEAGAVAAAGVFAASFAGMSNRRRIPNEWWILLTGIVVGLLVVYTTPYLGGSGGKLGTIAFGSCLAVYGILGSLHLVRVRRRLEDVPSRDVT